MKRIFRQAISADVWIAYYFDCISSQYGKTIYDINDSHNVQNYTRK